MQGRDPDHDDGAPGEGPPEAGYASRQESRSSEPPGRRGESGDSPAPPDPYRTSEEDADGSTQEHAQGPPGSPHPAGEPETGTDEGTGGGPPTGDWSTDLLRLAVEDPSGRGHPPPTQPPSDQYPQTPGPGSSGVPGPQAEPPPRWTSGEPRGGYDPRGGYGETGPGGPPGPSPGWAPPYGSGAPPGGAAPQSGPQSGAGSYGPPSTPYGPPGYYPQQPSGPRPIALIAGVVVAAVVLLGGGAIAYATLMGGGGGPRSAPPTPPPSSPPTQADQPSPPPSPSFDPGRIRNTEVDPKPLTLGEAFPRQRITIGDVTFQRVATDLATNCAEAGQSQFDPALRQADCLRVLRATFVDRNEQYAVTIGIAVVPNANEAQELAGAMVPQRNVWFAGLPGPEGSGAARIDESGGWSSKIVRGHYVAFSFATYAGKVTPPADSQQLNGLSNAMLVRAVRPVLARGVVTPSPTS